MNSYIVQKGPYHMSIALEDARDIPLEQYTRAVAPSNE